MHHEMRIRDPLMDRLDDVHREHVAGGLVREFIGAVRRADGHGKRVHLGRGDEIGRLIRVGQQLLLRELAFGAVPVFFSPWPVSRLPRQPSSPSTDTPTQCAISTTLEVMPAL